MSTEKELDSTEGDVNESPSRRHWEAEWVNSETRAVLEADALYFLHQSLSTPCLNALASCEGVMLRDVQGREYLDFHGNNVHQVGYSNPRVVEAVKRQLEELPFCPRRYTNDVAVALAARLVALAPGNLGKVLFAPAGALAISMALKLARAVTGRFKTISYWGSFHGASLDAISIGGESMFRSGIGPLLPGAIHVSPPPDCQGDDDDPGNADYVEQVMRNEGNIAAFIAEPIRCTDAVRPSKAYWKRIRELCDRHGALLIFDEIPTCLGRTGAMFACEHFDVVPDILTLGKGLGGGVMPMAAMVAREDLDIASKYSLGHFTHEKSPLGCAAALAVLDYIEEEDLVRRSRELGAVMLNKLEDLRRCHACILDIRGIGLLMAMELDDADRADRVLYACLRKGLSFKVSGGRNLTLTLPLTITETQMDTAISIIDSALSTV